MDEVRDVFRIEDPEVDVDALVGKIREGLAKRPPLETDVSTLLRMFGETPGDSPEGELLFAIQRLSLLLEMPIPSDRIRAPSGTDALLNRLRRPFHDVVRFYVDAHSERQDEVVRRVVAALTTLLTEKHEATVRADALADDVAALRDEVAALRAAPNRHSERSEESATPPVTDPSLRSG